MVPRYGDEPDEPGIVRVPGRRLPNDPEDRLVSWHGMHRRVLEAAADCDLIHIQTPFIAHYAGLAAARHLGMPVVVTYYTLFEEYLQHYVPFLPASRLRGLARRASRGASATGSMRWSCPRRPWPGGLAVMAQAYADGDPAHRHLAGAFPLLEGRRQRLPPAPWHQRRLPAGAGVGRVAHEKNIGFLIEAFAEAIRHSPDALLVTGEGPAMDDLRQQAVARAGGSWCASSAISTANATCLTATRPPPCSSLRPAPKPRGWC